MRSCLPIDATSSRYPCPPTSATCPCLTCKTRKPSSNGLFLRKRGKWKQISLQLYREARKSRDKSRKCMRSKPKENMRNKTKFNRSMPASRIKVDT